MTDPPFVTGSCRCGTVTLVIDDKPRTMLQCHCLDCQNATGTGHTSHAYFAEKDVYIRGQATDCTVIADGSSEMIRYLCPTYGSRMYGRNSERPDLISINVGCLDDHSWFSSQAVLFASRRRDRDITSDEVPNFERMTPKTRFLTRHPPRVFHQAHPHSSAKS